MTGRSVKAVLPQGQWTFVTIDIGSGSQTTTALTAFTTTPTIDKPVTLTATLKSGITPLSGKTITIYHYFKGVKYTDTTKKTTNANGQIALTQSFGSAGPRTYYATFAGDMWYKASTSAVVPIRVH